MEQINHTSLQRLVAQLLLTCFLLESCNKNAGMHEIGAPVEYIPGKLEYMEGEEPNEVEFSAPPYRPVVAPSQCAQIYEGNLEMGPYDQPQETVLRRLKQGGMEECGWKILLSGLIYFMAS